MTPLERRELIKSRIAGCYGDPIEKGGEGSKGGQVIGHTSSGKPVYANKGADHYKDFSKTDHAEAAKAHTAEFKKHAGTKESDWIQDRAKQRLHDKHATSHEAAAK